jgi:hypothetical protein
MSEKDNILKELTQLESSLASITNKNVYTVPNNYFNGIEKEFIARVEADFIYSSNKASFSVPTGYFDNLSTAVFEKIKAASQNEVIDEINNLSPTIANIGNANVYHSPAGYFDNLHFSTPIKNTGKLIKFGSPKTFVKYAAAAVIVGLLGFSAFYFLRSNTTQNEHVEVAALIKKADEIIKTNTFDATLESLSDKELEKYLTQNGEDVNASLVAETAEQATLPEAIDYYLDPTTLDNFLNENNLKN